MNSGESKELSSEKVVTMTQENDKEVGDDFCINNPRRRCRCSDGALDCHRETTVDLPMSLVLQAD